MHIYKTIIWLFFLCKVTNIVFAQEKETHIRGKVLTTPASSSIKLTRYDGTTIPIMVDKNGRFSETTTDIISGFYELDSVGTVYLRPGDRLTIKPDKDSIYRFSGSHSLCNQIMSSLYQAIPDFLPYDHKGLKQEAFFLEVADFQEKMERLEEYASEKIGQADDPFFKTLAVKDFHYFCKGLWQQYNSNYGIDQSKKALYDKLKSGTASDSEKVNDIATMHRSIYVKSLDSKAKNTVLKTVFEDLDWNDGTLFLNSKNYRMAIDLGVRYAIMYKPENRKRLSEATSKTDKLMLSNEIVHRLIKDSVILNHFDFSYTADLLKSVTDPGQLDSIYSTYMQKSNLYSWQKNQITIIYENRLAYSIGSEAPDFTYHTANDSSFTLSSLRGKYVYIDIWATWCGPCKAQIPHLSTLEHDFRDKNIAFVSVSIDAPKDTQKWKAYIAAQQMTGIQVIADNAISSTFIRKFNINAIPRFILLGPNGIIISADAKRPSDPSLREELNNLLD